MKKYFIPGFVFFAFAACGGPQPTTNAGGAVFEVSPKILSVRADTLIDMGVLRSGEIVRYDARLRNVGPVPMVIKEIKTTCGCTSVEYDKQPMAPNEEASFSFSLDSRGMWGAQMKLIEIFTSVSHRPFRVMVKAEVVEKSHNES